MVLKYGHTVIAKRHPPPRKHSSCLERWWWSTIEIDQQFLSASTVPSSSPEGYSRAGSSLAICAGARGSLKNSWRRLDRGLPIRRPHASQQVILYPGLSHWELYTFRACSFKPGDLPEKHDQASDSAYQFVPQLCNGIYQDFYNCVLWIFLLVLPRTVG